jgi:uncharacterized protein YndB with AHSA1/START domain
VSTTPDQIARDILIEAPVDVVWRVVTEPEHIARWFSDTAEVDLRPGGDGVLTFQQNGGVVAPLVVDTVEPPTTFAFRWSAPEGETPTADNSTLVTFSLAAEGERTRLSVVESGITALPGGEERHRAFYDDHSGGWATIVPRLGEYAPSAVGAAR